MPMMIAPPIAKEAVEAERIAKHKSAFNNIFNASYHSISIAIWQCPQHSNEFFIEASALGVSLPMLYWVNSMSIGIEQILEEVYKDFVSFVMIVRTEENETLQ
jgi:hypothetical protein